MVEVETATSSGENFNTSGTEEFFETNDSVLSTYHRNIRNGAVFIVVNVGQTLFFVAFVNIRRSKVDLCLTLLTCSHIKLTIIN